MNEKQIQQTNQIYRDGREPSELHKEAFVEVVTTGGLSEETTEKLVDRLYDPFPDRMKKLGGEPAENGLMKNVERKETEIWINVSEKLYHQQPIGVLLRPINDRVRRGGEAVVYDIDVYSESVRPGVMPMYHYSLRVQPTPVWLSKWIGESGYPTV